MLRYMRYRMNERIRELAKQSGLWFVTPREDLMDDFAELIVRECIDTINATAQQVRDSIKEHFGVEE